MTRAHFACVAGKENRASVSLRRVVRSAGLQCRGGQHGVILLRGADLFDLFLAPAERNCGGGDDHGDKQALHSRQAKRRRVEMQFDARLLSVSKRLYFIARPGRSSAWLEHQHGVLGVEGSNPFALIRNRGASRKIGGHFLLYRLSRRD